MSNSFANFNLIIHGYFRGIEMAAIRPELILNYFHDGIRTSYSYSYKFNVHAKWRLDNKIS